MRIRDLSLRIGTPDRQIRYTIAEGVVPPLRGGRAHADYGDHRRSLGCATECDLQTRARATAKRAVTTTSLPGAICPPRSRCTPLSTAPRRGWRSFPDTAERSFCA